MVINYLYPASRLLNAHRLLLKTLLRGLLPFVRSQGTRRLSSASEGLPIPALLKSILMDPKKFGSAVVSLGNCILLYILCELTTVTGLSLTAGIIHNEPTCYSLLQSAGLTDAVISFVMNNLMPSSEVFLNILWL